MMPPDILPRVVENEVGDLPRLAVAIGFHGFCMRPLLPPRLKQIDIHGTQVALALKLHLDNDFLPSHALML